MLRFVFICLVLLIKEFVDAQQAPSNAAAKIGANATFNCNSGTVVPQWRYSPTGQSGTDTPISLPGDCSLYDTSLSGFYLQFIAPNTCNLIVTVFDTSVAGVYICTDSLVFNRFAMLTVIEEIELLVFRANELLDPVENEQINMTCNVTYTAPSSTGLKMSPSIVWTNSSANVNITDAITVEMPTLITSHLMVYAIPPTVTSYSCVVYFNVPDVNANFATNAPTYTNTTKTPVLRVQYNGPSNMIETSYNESNICEAKILECIPNAYPPAISNYWLDVTRNKIFYRPNITGEYGGEYVCNVTNEINGVPQQEITAHSLQNRSAFTLEPCKGVNSSNAEITIVEGDCNLQNGTYFCKDAIEVTILCNSSGSLPIANVSWNGPCMTYLGDQPQITVKESGSYSCSMRNSYKDRLFEATAAVEITGIGNATSVQCDSECRGCNDCDPDLMCGGVCISDASCIALVVIVSLFGVNLILLCVFLLCYCFSKSYKGKINDKFQWIEKAWPCANDEGCGCSWELTLFITASVLVGIIFIPYVLIASECCRGGANRSQVDGVNLDERGQSTENGHQHGRPPPPKTSNSMGHPPPPNPQTSTRSMGAPSRGPPGSQSYNQSTRPPPPQSSGIKSSQSPVNPDAIVYQELKIDQTPRSRQPIQMINTGQEPTYADLNRT